MFSVFFYDFFFLRIYIFKTSTPKEKAMAKYKYPLGITPTDLLNITKCDKCAPSAISIKPINIKKESASI